uniref:Uncharacterized protein n=1 Tax=Arundo donax TaxID=35708 RepID=A0A0A9CKW0_ARUDO
MLHQTKLAPQFRPASCSILLPPWRSFYGTNFCFPSHQLKQDCSTTICSPHPECAAPSKNLFLKVNGPPFNWPGARNRPPAIINQCEPVESNLEVLSKIEQQLCNIWCPNVFLFVQ